MPAKTPRSTRWSAASDLHNSHFEAIPWPKPNPHGLWNLSAWPCSLVPPMIQTLLGPFFSLRWWFQDNTMYIHMLPYGTQQCSVLVHRVAKGLPKWSNPTGTLLGKELAEVDSFQGKFDWETDVAKVKHFQDSKFSNTWILPRTLCANDPKITSFSTQTKTNRIGTPNEHVWPQQTPARAKQESNKTSRLSQVQHINIAAVKFRADTGRWWNMITTKF